MRSSIATHFRHNEQIRISPVRLIDDKDEQIGIVPTREALQRAREAGLDLVEVAPQARPPVCRILDYGKWRYQQRKKESKSAKHKGGQLKEVKIRTTRISDHDLGIKTNNARKFLEEGNKVQFVLQYRGREMAHQELGREIFDKVKRELFFISKVEQDIRPMGRRISMVLQPDHKDPTKWEEVDGRLMKKGSAAAAAAAEHAEAAPQDPMPGPNGMPSTAAR